MFQEKLLGVGVQLSSNPRNPSFNVDHVLYHVSEKEAHQTNKLYRINSP